MALTDFLQRITDISTFILKTFSSLFIVCKNLYLASGDTPITTVHKDKRLHGKKKNKKQKHIVVIQRIFVTLINGSFVGCSFP